LVRGDLGIVTFWSSTEILGTEPFKRSLLEEDDVVEEAEDDFDDDDDEEEESVDDDNVEESPTVSPSPSPSSASLISIDILGPWSDGTPPLVSTVSTSGAFTSLSSLAMLTWAPACCSSSSNRPAVLEERDELLLLLLEDEDEDELSVEASSGESASNETFSLGPFSFSVGVGWIFDSLSDTFRSSTGLSCCVTVFFGVTGDNSTAPSSASPDPLFVRTCFSERAFRDRLA
jgi:hypothetical protein